MLSSTFTSASKNELQPLKLKELLFFHPLVLFAKSHLFINAVRLWMEDYVKNEGILEGESKITQSTVDMHGFYWLLPC